MLEPQQEVIRMLTETLKNHLDSFTYYCLDNECRERGSVKPVEEHFTRCAARFRFFYGVMDEQTQWAILCLGLAKSYTGEDAAGAEQLIQEFIVLRHGHESTDIVVRVKWILTFVLARQAKFAQAETLLRSLVDWLAQQTPVDDKKLLECLERLIYCMVVQGKPREEVSLFLAQYDVLIQTSHEASEEHLRSQRVLHRRVRERCSRTNGSLAINPSNNRSHIPYF